MTLRLAPQPSGPMHMGLARVALANALVARQRCLPLQVRFEDTDPVASHDEFKAPFLESLAWLGIPYGAVQWTQLGEVRRYHDIARDWLSAGHAFLCTCPPRQPCGGDRVHREGAPACVRVSLDGPPVVWCDAVYGPRRDPLNGSMVILRSDGRPLYHFACVADDVQSGVTWVVRGADHLSNTPRQLVLWRRFGVEPPQWAHVPLLLSPDGRKLSKSQNAPPLLELARQGILAETVLVALYTSGLGRLSTTRLLELIRTAGAGERLDRVLDLMASDFAWEQVSRANPVWHPERLIHLNRQVLGALPLAERADRTWRCGRQHGLWLRPHPMEPLVAALGARPRDLVEMALDVRSALAGPVLGPRARLAPPEAHGLVAVWGRPSGPRQSDVARILGRRRVAWLARRLERFGQGEAPAALRLDRLQVRRVRAYVEDVLGVPVLGVHPLTGYRNQVWRVDTQAGPRVVKVSATLPRALAEKRMLARGHPFAPHLRHFDLSFARFSGAVLVYDWLGGQGLSDWTDETALALGGVLRTLYAQPAPGVPPTPAGLLRTMALQLADVMAWREACGWPAHPLLEALQAELLALEPQAGRPSRARTAWVHGDLRPSNAVVDGERLALVDWENAAAGDPAEDVAWAMAYAHLPEAPFWEGLGDELRVRVDAWRPFVRLAWPLVTLSEAVRAWRDGQVGVGDEILEAALSNALGVPSPGVAVLRPRGPRWQHARIVAVEGPSSSLKSEVASLLAGWLGAVHLSAGMAFRAWTVLAERRPTRAGWTPTDVRFTPLSRYPYASVQRGRETLSLYGPRVEERVSRYARDPHVQAWAARLLDSVREGRSAMVDGRNVAQFFPVVTARIRLVAPLAARAAAKSDMFAHEGHAIGEARVAAQLVARDLADEALAPGPDAVPTLELDASADGTERAALKALAWLGTIVTRPT